MRNQNKLKEIDTVYLGKHTSISHHLTKETYSKYSYIL